jgi:hypothetical protein
MAREAPIDQATGRNFYLDYPDDLSGTEPVTFLLSLHGGGSFGAWQRLYFPAHDYAESHRLAGPRSRLPDVVDTEPGQVYDKLREGRSSAAWGLMPRPGTAQIYVYPGADQGRLIADVIRLGKGHAEGLEPNITRELVTMIVAAPGGKARSAVTRQRAVHGRRNRPSPDDQAAWHRVGACGLTWPRNDDAPGAIRSRGRAGRRCAVASRRVAQRGSSRTVVREGSSCGPGDTTHRRCLGTAGRASLFRRARPAGKRISRASFPRRAATIRSREARHPRCAVLPQRHTESIQFR